ncbi:hypothetical protein FQ142_07925 [Microbacterium sp. ANT_H45B]|uniref:hypothetical protein n=1 Tax=Microbacterium sp. ANT_H45B TaxID=2597346 RepID=UPI0011EC3679|nr:hypothetical protein [Microbacterium sp. ANT_H45B]KAA0960802.1 hypothetical protein FQ142_07925 [Microbacterium sp. ANT_H45B]
MPTYDWSFMSHRSGESIESLVATLLRLEYSDARQVNPSQGDGGIDIIRETPDGVIVWQVKGFTTALSSSQFRQVKSSWVRFNEEHVGAERPPVLEYHLVTPWTPTEERLGEFRDMVGEAGFNCVWDGDAYLSGLGDRHPATMHRFTYGDGALEQFVNQKAMIASSPVERADSISMMSAIETRQDALNELRDQLDDNYRIEHGTLTVSGEGPPMPPGLSDPAIFHRMEYLGDGRWKYQSVVPRSADATSVDPVSWDVTFLEEAGSEGAAAIQEWADWGTPFQNVRGRVRMIGGPLPDPADDIDERESRLSFAEVKRADPPPLYLRCLTAAGDTRFRFRLIPRIRTTGAKTGWMKLVTETPEGIIRFDIRIKGEEGMQVNAEIGQLHGKDPESVLAEARVLLQVAEGDVFSVEINQTAPLFKSHGTVLPTALEGTVVPMADALSSLQSRTSAELRMPDMASITDSQFGLLLRYASIYGGTAHVWRWREISIYAPTDVSEIPAFIEQIGELLGGKYIPVYVEEPVFKLGEDSYKIDHPLVTTRHSVRLVEGQDLDAVQPGEQIRLGPGADEKVTTAMVVDWTPGTSVF